jgi:acyl-CoA synthetase (NDP forming)
MSTEATIRSPASTLGLWAPSAVTIVGASPDSFFASALLENLTASAYPFQGPLALVSRSRTEIDGRPCVASLAEVEDPGLVYLLVGAAQCLPVLQQARGRVDGVVVITSDLDAEQEAGLVGWAAERGVPLLGPNCMGLLSLGTGFFGYAGPLPELSHGRIGLVMQSGGMLSGVVGALSARGLGVGTAVSYGNAASLDFLDLALPILHDDGIDALLVYSESVRDVRHLRVLGAEARLLGKHVVLVQGGQSEAGSEAARSHTGMLATPARIVAGVAAQAGIIACSDLEEAVWSLEALATPALPAPREGGVVVLSSSGGGAVALADAADRIGLALQPPSTAGATNPMDVGAGIMNRPEAIDELLDSVARDYSVLVHIAGVGLPQPALPRHTAIARQLADRARAGGLAVVLCAIVGSPLPPDDRWDGVAYASSAREGVAKARALAMRAAHVDTELPQFAAGSAAPTRLLTGTPARDALGSLRVAWPRTAEVPESAGSVGREVGFPLVLKVEQLAHRLTAGGLIRSVPDEAVLDAANRYLRAHFPGAPISAHEQVGVAAELIVGMVRSPEHGPLISFGMGGSDVGERVAFASAPLSDADIDGLVRPYLARIAGPAQLESMVAAAAALVRDVADLVDSHPEIASLDLNPVAVALDGRLVALDCKMEVTA